MSVQLMQRPKMAENNVPKRQSCKKKPTMPKAPSPSPSSIADNLADLSVSGRGGDLAKSTGAVSKRYKTRHPTDPLPNSSSASQRASYPSTEKKQVLSTSDTHLSLGSTAVRQPSATLNSSSGSSPTSNSSSTLGRTKKSSSVHGSSGRLSPSPKIHVLLCSRDNMNASSSSDDVKNGVQSIPEDSGSEKLPGSKQSKGPKTPKKEKTFETYMMLDQVQQGLKKGELIEGVLRINPKNFQDAYISVPVILGGNDGHLSWGDS